MKINLLAKREGIAAIAIVTLCLAGCNRAPAFTGGIRMVSLEAISGITNSQMPIPGILVDGYVESPVPYAGGNLGSFEGLTGAYGIYDSPNAYVGATWYLQFTFSNVIPECNVPTGGQVQVSPSGTIEFGTCYVFGT